MKPLVLITIFFSLLGFDDAITFKRVDEDTITHVESFIKNKLDGFLDQCDDPQTVYKEDFYGNIFAADPSSFKFSLGDRIRIMEVASFVKRKVDGINGRKPLSGIKFFGKAKRHKSTGRIVHYPKLGRFFSNRQIVQENKLLDEQEQVNSQTNFENIDKKLNSDEVQDAVETRSSCVKLYSDVMKLYRSLNVEEEALNRFTESMVTVSLNEDAAIIGQLKCFLCVLNGTKSKAEFFKIQRKTDGSNAYWNLSNYIKHVKKKHPLKQSLQGQVEENNQNRIEVTDEIASDQKSLSIIEIENAIPTQQSIYNQISNQILHMTEKFHSNKEIKHEMLFECGELRPLDVLHIPTDGNCMFASIIHQLHGPKVNSEEFSQFVKQLRAEVVVFIETNIRLFQYELEDRVMDKLGKKTIDNMDEEMKTFVSKDLSSDGFWGGSETLKAVNLLYSLNILIINEKGSFYFTSPFQSAYQRTLVLAYKMVQFIGENQPDKHNHYDSVVHIDPTIIFDMTAVISSRMQETVHISLNDELDE